MSAFEIAAARDEHAGEEHACARLRVVLVDDNIEFVDRAEEVLDKDFEIVGKFYDGESFLYGLPQLKPDAITLDISMGKLNGIEVAQRLKQSKCGARIVFLSVHEGPEFVSAALAAGAAGYVFKTRLGTDLIPAIFCACSGRVFVSLDHP